MIFKASAVALIVSMSMNNFRQSSSLSMNDFSGLVRHYSADNTLVDATGSGNDLIASGGSVRYETVKAGELASNSRRVFELNGSSWDGYCLRGSTAGLPLGNSARTMLGWARIDAASSTFAFAYGRSGCNKAFNFRVHHTKLSLEYNCDNTFFDTGFQQNNLGKWRHYAFTHDGNNLKVYIDGVNVFQRTNSGPKDTLSGDFAIGGNFHGGIEPLYGAVAEIAIFNRALTASEVMQIANIDAAGSGGDPHFYGFGASIFSWQGECDTVLFKSPKCRPTDSDIEVHIRTRMVRKWSAIDAIAVKVNGFIGEIESEKGKLIADGNQIESVELDFLSVERKRGKKKIVLFTFVIDKDKVLEIKVNTRTKMIFTTLSGNYPPSTVGLLGSPSSPGQFTRDGIDMTGKDVNAFSESWQVNDSDQKLFIENRDPQYPAKCVYHVSKSSKVSRRLRESKMIKMEDAVTACAFHKPGPFREFCVYDVYSSGDLDIGQDSFYG